MYSRANGSKCFWTIRVVISFGFDRCFSTSCCQQRAFTTITWTEIGIYVRLENRLERRRPPNVANTASLQ